MYDGEVEMPIENASQNIYKGNLYMLSLPTANQKTIYFLPRIFRFEMQRVSPLNQPTDLGGWWVLGIVTYNNKRHYVHLFLQRFQGFNDSKKGKG